MSLRTFFGAEHVCGLGVSPPIRLDGGPREAAGYRVRFTNVSVLRAPAPEYTVAFTPGEIPQGAIEGYRGPCPGEMMGFQFRVEVMAVDAAGRPLAYGYNFATALNPSRAGDVPGGGQPRVPLGAGEIRQ
jgi:hypothetical protein